MLAHRPAERRLVGLAALLFLVLAAQRFGPSSPSVLAHSARQTPPATSAPEPTLAPLVRLYADATAPFEGPSSDPYASCGLSAPASPDLAPWGAWVSMAGPRLAAESPDTELPVYCARVPDGAAALLVNRATGKRMFRLSIRCSRGVYTVERLTFDTKMPETGPAVERLESMVLGGTGQVQKLGSLEAGQGAIYRVINRSQQTASAFKNVKERVRPLMSSRETVFARLMTPLRECESQIGALSSGIQPRARADALKHIHRALLTVSHAQALCQNFSGEGRLPSAQGNGLEDALSHLEESLTELSAGCLNLVPGLDISAPDPAHPDERMVTISVANAGSLPVRLMRIGTSAPSPGTVRPAEDAMFEALDPGQTARAIFVVRLAQESDANSITGDVSYFVARVPARLRLHH